MKEAWFYETLEDEKLKCLLCPHKCVISSGKSGLCGARKNISGILYSLNYGVVSGMNIDPIEKKPLYHYYPGCYIFSVGTLGCNLKCPFCQNDHLSRFFDYNVDYNFRSPISPEDLFQTLSVSLKRSGYNVIKGIAYTYSEPLVWYEFVYESSSILRDKGYKNVLVTNGYVEKEPLDKLIPLVDAANVDLKAFTEENYRKLSGNLRPVMDFITSLKEKNVHIEVTTLVVPGLNDNMEELEKLVKWLSSLDKSIPFHLSRYYPAYKYNKPPTSIDFLHEVKKMADSYLNYVYLGNVAEAQNTYCPECKNLLVLRNGYDVSIVGIVEGKCGKCGRKADFVL